jgi:hypothetical protein
MGILDLPGTSRVASQFALPDRRPLAIEPLVNKRFARLSPLVGPVEMGQDDWAQNFRAV